MTSLFSPFDLCLFSIPFLFFFFSTFILLNYLVKLNLLGASFSNVLKSLGDFFSSLKPKHFGKSSIFLFLTVFTFLLVFNLFSVFPFNFPGTSQVSLVMWISGSFWLSMVAFSTFMNFKGSISHFIPEGTPIPLTIFLFLIELISSIIRPLTLTVRLAANILAGHLLMSLLSSLVFLFELSSIFYLGLNLVEMFVAMIQAYIFTTMIVLYFSEV